MKSRARKYAWSLAIAIMLTALGVVLPDLGVRMVEYLVAPGTMAGWILFLFPQGGEGYWVDVYLVVTLLMNVFIYSWVVFGIWVLIERARRRN